MTYRSTRCRHKMCLDTVGCEICGVKPKAGAGQHLRRATERKLADPRVPVSYKREMGHGSTGNTNARTRG